MITIIQRRGTGKAKELLKAAREHGAAIITQDKRAFEVKAKSYGFSDVEILDYSDLTIDNYLFNKPILIHNGDKMLYWLLEKFYGLETIGFTATVEDKKNV